MFKAFNFKNIKLPIFISHLVVSLGYPTAKALSAPSNRLLLFTNALTIIALLLVIGGIVYSMVLHGDFDISSYYLQRGVKSVARRISYRRGEDLPEGQKSIDAFLSDAREEREEAFNYPLFLGLVYLLVSAVIAFGFLS